MGDCLRWTHDVSSHYSNSLFAGSPRPQSRSHRHRQRRAANTYIWALTNYWRSCARLPLTLAMWRRLQTGPTIVYQQMWNYMTIRLQWWTTMLTKTTCPPLCQTRSPIRPLISLFYIPILLVYAFHVTYCDNTYFFSVTFTYFPNITPSGFNMGINLKM